ncbi:hypothetical protein Tco_0713460, partial [Tanacetum coccineum]
SRACSRAYAPFSKYPPMKVLLMTLQNAPRGLDYEGDKKFSKVSLQFHGVPMIALICLHVPKMTALYYGTLILSRSPLNFQVGPIRILMSIGHWHPKLHGVISASSFHGKIGIYKVEAYARYSVGEDSELELQGIRQRRSQQHIDGGGANVILHSAGLSPTPTTNGDSLNTLTFVGSIFILWRPVPTCPPYLILAKMIIAGRRNHKYASPANIKTSKIATFSKRRTKISTNRVVNRLHAGSSQGSDSRHHPRHGMLSSQIWPVRTPRLVA